MNESNKNDNIWLLTEERPKPSVVSQIIEMYSSDFDDDIIKTASPSPRIGLATRVL